MVDRQESRHSGASHYELESLPEDMLGKMLDGIVGFEIEVTRTEAGAKLSQNQNRKDYESIIGKLMERGDLGSIEVARQMQLRKKRIFPD
jgi:transcriptional regulator